jgi:GntR family phosphonate transport system transcriptional regulator
LTYAGLRGALQVLQFAEVEAGLDEAQALRVHEGSALLYLQVLGEGAGQPLHVSERYFPLPRFANLAEVVQNTGSITEAFAQHGVMDYLRQESRISARLPNKEVADLLAQPMSCPALMVTSLNVDTAGLPIEFSKAWFAGDRVTLTVNHHDS